MNTCTCTRCGKPAQAPDAAFCAYCGAPLAAQAPIPEGAQALLREADRLADPVRKRERLLQAQAQYPDSLAVAEAILYLGRLHERSARKMDFSVIKCHLWHLYLTPEEFSAEKRDAMRRELFTHPDLQRCQALAPDADAFTRQYLERLAREFIRLFLRGSNRYMHAIFGLRVDARASRTLAAPVSHMLARIHSDSALTPEQREMLYTALYRAFATDMDGDTQYLDSALRQANLRIPV